jgi:hypothetical protein
MLRFSALMTRDLAQEQADADTHRDFFATMAGFSFTGVLALVALPGDLNERALPIWYLLLSFLAYLGALNLQGYKHYLWQDLAGDALRDLASGTLVGAVVAFVVVSALPVSLRVAVTALAVLGWSLDVCMRVRSKRSYLQSLENPHRPENSHA